MTLDNKQKTIIARVGFVLLPIFLVYQAYWAYDCSQRGGTNVRGFIGYYCMGAK